jgi:hypothetical protein
LPSYKLVTFRAPAQIGTSTLTLADAAGAPAGAEIVAGVLPIAGARLAVRVGSCLQWHGYRGHKLYLTQQAGTPVRSLTLSGVAG